MNKDERTVFFTKIPFSTTESTVRDLFGRIGPVELVTLICDKETKKPKGFGFVTYHSPDSARCAVRMLNGFKVDNMYMIVNHRTQQQQPQINSEK